MGQSSVLLHAMAAAAGPVADAALAGSCLGRVWQQMKAPVSACSRALRRRFSTSPQQGRAIQQSCFLQGSGGNLFPLLKAVSAVPGWVGKADRNMVRTELC